MSYTLKSNILDRLIVFKKESKKEGKQALVKCAVQLLTNVVTGIPTNSTPPVLTGNLRASGSVMINQEFIKDSQSITGDKGTPDKSINFNAIDDNTITIKFNTPYAAKMHEWTGGWGERTLRAGNAGNKYLEKHLKGDAVELTKLWAAFMEKEVK